LSWRCRRTDARRLHDERLGQQGVRPAFDPLVPHEIAGHQEADDREGADDEGRLAAP
jgi:hypothetical protein